MMFDTATSIDGGIDIHFICIWAFSRDYSAFATRWRCGDIGGYVTRIGP